MKFTCFYRQEDRLKKGNGVFRILQQIPDYPEGKDRIFGELLGGEVSRHDNVLQDRLAYEYVNYDTHHKHYVISVKVFRIIMPGKWSRDVIRVGDCGLHG